MGSSEPEEHELQMRREARQAARLPPRGGTLPDRPHLPGQGGASPWLATPRRWSLLAGELSRGISTVSFACEQAPTGQL